MSRETIIVCNLCRKEIQTQQSTSATAKVPAKDEENTYYWDFCDSCTKKLLNPVEVGVIE